MANVIIIMLFGNSCCIYRDYDTYAGTEEQYRPVYEGIVNWHIVY